jgi:hypothetical protein
MGKQRRSEKQFAAGFQKAREFEHDLGRIDDMLDDFRAENGIQRSVRSGIFAASQT